MKKILNSKTLISLVIMANLLVQVSCNTEEENSEYNIELADSVTQKVGKSTLTVKVTEKESGTAVSGLNVALVPWMVMETMKHSTPVQAVSDNGDGTYSGTVYYLMPTSAPTGMKMGDWTVKVKINDTEKAELPVTVSGMSTDKITLKGQADKYLNMDMGMAESRNYFLFVNEIKSDSDTDFSIKMFLATRESMEKHPYVYTGRELVNEASEPWTVDTVNLEISLDGTNWTAMQESDDKDGTYQVTGFSGLTTGKEATIYFRLTVNNEQKTTNGDAPDDNTTDPANTNEFGKLTVTP